MEGLNKDFLDKVKAKHLEKVTPREEKILKLYYGIESDKYYSTPEIAKHFKVTHERVLQILERAERKLYFYVTGIKVAKGYFRKVQTV